MRADTIVALATAPGRAGVAVIRLSGPAAGPALESLIGRRPPPRKAVRARFTDPESGAVLDDGLALWFPGPASFTGEDVAELHGHGGRAVVESLLDVLCRMPGLRVAEPGEFTRRAFEHGKMDLTQAEGLADLINAETEAQARQALRQMDGALARLYEGWRGVLVPLLAHVEAYIDFPDEDLPDSLGTELHDRARDLVRQIRAHLDDGHRGERVRDGLYIAVLGPPNAGKSSLVNAIAKRDAAIVSATAGTTRDVVEVHLDLGGYPAVLADTAGLREAADDIEGEGIRRALARAETADLRVVVFDGEQWPRLDAATAALIDDRTLVVVNKIDRCAEPGRFPIAGQEGMPISVKTGEGMDVLLFALEAEVRARLETRGAPALTRRRHRAALEDCAAALDRALTAPGIDLMAEDLRLATRALGRITGRVDVEDLLDIIFRDFCIGK
ncbi:tRNA uridine-5-carboxymethylaminomethyl(34) synthesis GTPase MnmE [Novispirillum sp. DQ9]|uniref:tRNA uridine-5-carboxymethylaminomethyl(34) synthesis GTPase MnmE n=1 Tax=Novispirillum sp. DQ9 TaxID=3398612 RepID=UPI003C7A505B